MYLLYRMLSLFLYLCLFTSASAVSFVSTGSTVILNGIPYYVPANPVTTLPVQHDQFGSAASVAGLVPLTVLETSVLTFTQKDFDATIASYTAIDDVFQPGFLQGISLHALSYEKIHVTPGSAS